VKLVKLVVKMKRDMKLRNVLVGIEFRIYKLEFERDVATYRNNTPFPWNFSLIFSYIITDIHQCSSP
jgi:hypothetical protein